MAFNKKLLPFCFVVKLPEMHHFISLTKKVQFRRAPYVVMEDPMFNNLDMMRNSLKMNFRSNGMIFHQSKRQYYLITLFMNTMKTERNIKLANK